MDAGAPSMKGGQCHIYIFKLFDVNKAILLMGNEVVGGNDVTMRLAGKRWDKEVYKELSGEKGSGMKNFMMRL